MLFDSENLALNVRSAEVAHNNALADIQNSEAFDPTEIQETRIALDVAKEMLEANSNDIKSAQAQLEELKKVRDKNNAEIRVKVNTETLEKIQPLDDFLMQQKIKASIDKDKKLIKEIEASFTHHI